MGNYLKTHTGNILKDGWSEYDVDQEKEYNFKILVYPNITYQSDLEKDSYVVVLCNIIKEMNKVRDDIHWTILSPMKLSKSKIKSLEFENTTQLYIDFPSYPNGMRTHFDYRNFMKAVNWKSNDFDVIYSHLPEHTNLIVNAISNTTNIDPKYIGGYCHWFEVKENTNYSKNLFRENISGILEMEECGLNSVWLKELILEKTGDYFNTEVIKKLKKIMQPHYLGIDNSQISMDNSIEEKTILFNHRDNGYTGWNWFWKRMDELYKKRQDFKVYTTLADPPKIKVEKKDILGKVKKDKDGNVIYKFEKRKYATRVEIHGRDEYLKFVGKMTMGVGCFQTYSAWSISTTDGLSQGVPYVLPNKLCYPEMLGDDYPLLYNDKDDFLEKIENLLDNPILRKKMNKHISKKIHTFSWSERVPQWFSGWKFLDNMKMIGDNSESYKKIYEFIKKNGYTTKKDITEYLNWGVRISFSAYRNRLRTEPDIKLTRYGYQYIGSYKKKLNDNKTIINNEEVLV